MIGMLLLTATSCLKNEFTAEISLPENVTRTYKTLYYASNSKMGLFMEGVMTVDHGKGLFKGVTRNPLIVYVFGSGNMPVTFFYAERGDKIEITGKSDNPVEWEIGGNDINKQLTEWRLKNVAALKSWNVYSHQGSEAVNKAVVEYIKGHPSDPVSTLLLLEYYDRESDEAGFVKAWNMLKGKAKDGKWRELVSRGDMLHDPAGSELPSQWVVREIDGSADTIIFRQKPMLLHFNVSSNMSFGSNADKMKSMAQNSGAAAVFANIIMDTDSMAVDRTVREDSLSTVINAWVPLGISDSNVNKMGVRSVPYLMVVDKQGKTVYRGNDMIKAEQEFEKLKNQ